ncbi:MAG: InlB B-repeat-containing protein [Saccharofermentans sp.]|nr:InlB B-repeat-containing protein [Saccharofermentans sp.]
MKKKFWALLVSIMVFIGAVPGLPVLAATATYWITFETDDLYDAPDAQPVNEGERGSRPDSLKLGDPSKETGISFQNWCTKPANELASYSDLWTNVENGGCIFTSNMDIEGDTKIYAVSQCVIDLKTVNLSSDETVGGTVSYSNIYFSEPQTGEASYTAIYDTSATVTATPAEGYKFVCWSTSETAEGKVSGDSEYTFTVKGSTSLYAIFEKIEYVTLTVSWTSIDEDSINSIPTLPISVPKGTTIGEALEQAGLKTVEGGDPIAFEKDGYKGCCYLYKSVTEYETYDGVFNEAVDFYEAVVADTTIYYYMAITVDNIELQVEKPVAGQSSANDPVVSVADDAHYVTSADGQSLFSWLVPENDPDATVDPQTERTVTVFKDGITYTFAYGVRPELGWCFTPETTGTLNGNDLENLEADTLSVSGTAEITAEKATVPEDGGESGQGVIVIDEGAGQAGAAVEPEGRAEEVLSGSDREQANGAAAADVEQANNSGFTGPVAEPEVKYYVEENGTEWKWEGGYWWSKGPSDSGFKHTTVGPFHINFYDQHTDLVRKLISASLTNSATGESDTLNKNADNTLTSQTTGEAVGLVKSGSVIIDLYPAYLNSLEAGDYTLTAVFDDGSISIKFTVAAKEVAPAPATDTNKAGSNVPATGEAISSTMIWGAVLVSISVIGASTVLDKKRLGKKDVK